jgi:hypothetical protein
MNLSAAQRIPVETDICEPLSGLAALMTMAFSGIELAPVGAQLIARAQSAPDDANALMDLSTVLQLMGNKDIGLAAQAQALQLQQQYRLPARGCAAAIRLLAVMAPGDLMANTPLEFLLQGSDVTLEMLYIVPGLPFPPLMPEHDLLFVAVCESDQNQALLQQLDILMRSWHRPVCNLPARIGRTSRETAHALLAAAPELCIPISARVDRHALARICRQELGLTEVLEDGSFPVILRPVDSHAGHGLIKIDAPNAIEAYLQTMPEDEFYISRFVDYRSADNLFRKYRVVLIDGRAYAGHMGISDHWMIHYLNAGMTENAEKRAEEERFMTSFDEDFALRHSDAFAAITAHIGLDYLVIDCGETKDGKLLVFELDSGAVVHSMDPVDLFPYKQAQMQKVFKAFREMLSKAIESAGQLRSRREPRGPQQSD